MRESKLFSIVVVNSKVIAALSAGMLALDLKIDQQFATVIVAVCVMISSMWQSWMLSKVHTLVNSNFSEAKAARLAAETALGAAQDLNRSLTIQLDESKIREKK